MVLGLVDNMRHRRVAKHRLKLIICHEKLYFLRTISDELVREIHLNLAEMLKWLSKLLSCNTESLHNWKSLTVRFEIVKWCSWLLWPSFNIHLWCFSLFVCLSNTGNYVYLFKNFRKTTLLLFYVWR